MWLWSSAKALYRASDWTTAFYAAEAMSRNLNFGRFSAYVFQAVMSAMSVLRPRRGRHRAGAELERESGASDSRENARVTLMDSWV
ncbi:phage terminase small subunit [Streptomyces sp. NPDC054962]